VSTKREEGRGDKNKVRMMIIDEVRMRLNDDDHDDR